MNIHSDFTQRIVLDTESMPWQETPTSGVTRKMLDRIGDEVARATTVVQYAPHSTFNQHLHGAGEEIFVLEGIFGDEHGSYPAGTYLRNPPGSRHTPVVEEGCLLFVKLRQFAKDDSETVCINTKDTPWRQGMVPGLQVMPLHEHHGISTALVRWAPNTIFNAHIHPGGEEIFVLEGVFHDENGAYPKGSWLRSPCYSKHAPFTQAEGALIYVKVGHLQLETIN